MNFLIRLKISVYKTVLPSLAVLILAGILSECRAYDFNYTVIVGSMAHRANAERLRKIVKKQGYLSEIYEAETNIGKMHRVGIGLYPSVRDAVAARDTIMQKTRINTAWVLYVSPTALNPGIAEAVPPELGRLKSFTREMLAGIINGTAAVDSFINQKLGLYVISKSGKIPVVIKTQSLKNVLPLATVTIDDGERKYLSDLKKIFAGDMVCSDQPEIGSRKNECGKTGIFIGTATAKDKKLSKIYKKSKRTMGENVSRPEYLRLVEAENSICAALSATGTEAVKNLYFAWERGRWQLIAINLYSPARE